MGVYSTAFFVACFSAAAWWRSWTMTDCIVIICLVAAALLCFSFPSTEDNAGDSSAPVAASARREGAGSLKYCGLRPNPMDATLPLPAYSLKPLQLPLPSLTAVQKSALEELTNRVKDLSPAFRTDPGTLVRFLRARQFRVDATEAYFREAMAWWKKKGIKECLSTWNLEAYERCFAPWYLSGGFFGHGRKGEMIAYERLSRCGWPKWVRKMPREHLAKLDVIHCMRSLAACEEDSMRTGRPLGDGILVEDCDGFGFDQANLSCARALNRLIKARNLLMPECLSKILVVNAPRSWVWAWGSFSWILDEGIKSKVSVARPGRETIECLRKFISDEHIPAYLGGSKYIDGDAECGKCIAPGGHPPEFAFTRFFELVKDEDEAIKRRGSTASLESQAQGDQEPDPEPIRVDQRDCMVCPRRSNSDLPERSRTSPAVIKVKA